MTVFSKFDETFQPDGETNYNMDHLFGHLEEGESVALEGHTVLIGRRLLDSPVIECDAMGLWACTDDHMESLAFNQRAYIGPREALEQRKREYSRTSEVRLEIAE